MEKLNGWLFSDFDVPPETSESGPKPEIGKKKQRLSGSRYHPIEMESRYVDTMQVTNFSDGHMQLHSHPFYEILYCRSSGGVEYLVGAERYRLQKGDIVLIAPDVSHRPILPEHMTEPYIRDVLRVNADLLMLLARIDVDEPVVHDLGTRLLRTAGTQWEHLGHLFRRGIQEAEQRSPGWEYAVLGNTVQLLIYLYRAVLDKNAMSPKAEKPELLDRVLMYVESHLSQKITLADVARQFFVSESTISQTFRNKMGVSFYRCVTQRRLIAAKILIQEGMSLENVSQAVGFMDYSAFYRAFRQEFGVSPRQFRKSQP